MTGIEVFNLVGSLSRKEKAQFRQLFHAGKGKYDYFNLYEELLNQRKYNEARTRQVLCLEDPQKFYNAKRTLVDRIIHSLIYQTENKSHTYQYIIIAVEKGLVSHARQKLKNEIREAYQQGDIDRLFYTSQLAIQVKASCQIEIDFPKSIPAFIEIQDIYTQTIRVRKLQEDLKVIAKSSPEENPLSLEIIRQEISHIDITFGIGIYVQKKVISLISLLTNDFEVSIPLFEDVVRCLEKCEFPLKEGFLIKELWSLATLAIHCNQPHIASSCLFKLSNLKFNKRIFRQQRTKYWTKTLLTISSAKGDLKLAKQGLISAKTNRALFENDELAVQYLGIAIVHFAHGEYSNCISIINDVRSLPLQSWDDFEWTLELVLILAHWENQNIELIDMLFRRLTSIAAKSDRVIPQIICKVIRRIINSGENQWLDIWKRWEVQYLASIQAPKEKILAESFDFHLWIQSKIEKIPLQDIFFRSDQSDCSQFG